MSLLSWLSKTGNIASDANIKYQKHIDDLAKQLNCTTYQKRKMPGMMYVEFGYIEGPLVECQMDYMVMLHELGHVAHGHTQGRPPQEHKKFYFTNGVLRSEAQAWEWALDHSIDKVLDKDTHDFMWNTCLGSYYSCSKITGKKPYRLTNGNRHWVEFVFDEPDDYFWAIVKRVKGS